MLALIPPIRPDELVPYSTMARYWALLDCKRKEAFIKAFVHPLATHGLWLDYPFTLHGFMQNLPPNHQLTMRQLLQDHSLWPWLSFGMTTWERKFCSGSWRWSSPRGYRWRAWSMEGFRGPRNTWLRYCPACLQEDFAIYGEGHWRRLPQIPGVFVCPVHRIFLENSAVPYPHRGRVSVFEPPGEELLVYKVRKADMRRTLPRFCMRAAKEVEWILTHDTPALDVAQLQPKLGYRTGSYPYDPKPWCLVEDLKHEIPSDYLRLIGNFSEMKTGYYNREFAHGSGMGQFSLYYLLLILARGESVAGWLERLRR